MNKNIHLFQIQSAVVFLGQDLIREYSIRTNGIGEEYSVDQEIIASQYLNNINEREIFAVLNLLRMNPMHVVNSILEPMRNRYNFKDKTYHQIVNLNRGE